MNDMPQTSHNSPKKITICLIQRMLLAKRSSNENLTWMFFPFGRKMLEVPGTCTCSVAVLRCAAGWDVEQQVMGGVSERLLSSADVRAEGNVL